METQKKTKILYVIAKSNWGEKWWDYFTRLVEIESLRTNKWTVSVRKSIPCSTFFSK